MPYYVSLYTGALAIILLALVSENTQWFLLTRPVQFLGRISYSLYLIHLLFVQWSIVNTMRIWTDEDEGIGLSRERAGLYAFLLYTPALICVSWLLERFVDAPSKELAGEIERELRNEDKSSICKDQKMGLLQFVRSNRKIQSLIVWLIFVFVVTNVFNRDRKSVV